MRAAAPVVLAIVAVLLALTGCSANPPAPAAATPAPRSTREDLMPQYLEQWAALYSTDPTYGYLYKDGLDEQERYNTELDGRKMCAAILSGIPPEKAYEAANPQVVAAGNASARDIASGRLAAQYLCPAT